MKKPKFSSGDWCFCEFKLQQVQETKEDRITEVSDGNFRLGSHDLTDRCFPLDLRIKQISDNTAYWSKQIHNLNCNSLNHPDINRKLIDLWAIMCGNPDDNGKLEKQYKELAEFANGIIKAVENLRNDHSVGGVDLFRR